VDSIDTPPVRETQSAKPKEILILSNVLFETNRADLKQAHLPELDGLCSKMLQNARWTLVITGHTDNLGSMAHNQQLSANRANTIAEYLQKKGIDAKRIQKKGAGSTQPIATNQTLEGREKNRRVEIEIQQE
jgi:outer membrane protein OmpA-like peptidoglycan-associated protein